MKTTSCQVIGISLSIWKQFRQKCISDEISCNKRLLQLIEESVASEKPAGESQEGRTNEKEQDNGQAKN